MFLVLAITLVVLWLASVTLFKTSAFLPHLFVVLAVISVIMHFVMMKRKGRVGSRRKMQ